jgi:hypothetical protein
MILKQQHEPNICMNSGRFPDREINIALFLNVQVMRCFVPALVLLVLWLSFFAAGQNNPVDWKVIGDRLFKQGDFQGAIDRYNKIGNPDAETLYKKSRAYNELGKPTDGKICLDEAKKIDPSIVRKHEIESTLVLIDNGGEPRSNNGKNISLITWNFETGNCKGWVRKGRAFENQPTSRDDIQSRQSNQSLNYQGKYWIGTYKNCTGSSPGLLGSVQGDGPTGEMISFPFIVQGNSISFLLGGGRSCSVNLIIDDQIALSANGKDNETMERVDWNVSAFKRKIAQIKIIDNSSSEWGHVNFDDVRFDLHPIIKE